MGLSHNMGRLLIGFRINRRNGRNVGAPRAPEPMFAAKLACRAPTSGGQYHWVSEFAPRRVQRFLSYMTGKGISSMLYSQLCPNFCQQDGFLF